MRTAELRTQVYWQHSGASFTEQLESFGLPNLAEYNWDQRRPAGFDPGLEYNPWLEYVWDTALEFALMMLDTERYAGQDVAAYLPFVESCVTFFDQHYQYLARQRGAQALDGNGRLIIYPGSGAETYKMAYNDGLVQLGLAAAGDVHGGSLGQQAFGGGQPNARATPGYQHGLVCKARRHG